MAYPEGEPEGNVLLMDVIMTRRPVRELAVWLWEAAADPSRGGVRVRSVFSAVPPIDLELVTYTFDGETGSPRELHFKHRCDWCGLGEDVTLCTSPAELDAAISERLAALRASVAGVGATSDLLAACKTALHWLEVARTDAENEGGEDSQQAKSFAEPIKKIVLAIKKAEGS